MSGRDKAKCITCDTLYTLFSIFTATVHTMSSIKRTMCEVRFVD